MSFSARLMQPEATSGSATGLPIRAVINKVTRGCSKVEIFTAQGANEPQGMN